jgi:23S rRNA pseudouridine2605 synthase
MATEAYEVELAGFHLDDAGQPIEVGHQASQEWTMKRPAAAPKAGRGRKVQADIVLSEAETSPTTKRKRRTKAEMAAAAAGVAGAAAAVAATVAVTKRRRGTKAETTDAAPTPAANVALRRPRKSKRGTVLPRAEPASFALASEAANGAVPDPSADGPADVVTGLVPDPGAEPPSGATSELSPERGPEADPSGERVAD